MSYTHASHIPSLVYTLTEAPLGPAYDLHSGGVTDEVLQLARGDELGVDELLLVGLIKHFLHDRPGGQNYEGSEL